MLSLTFSLIGPLFHHRFALAEAAAAQPVFNDLVATRAMLVQQFQPTIATDGERSLIYIAGRFTHAVVKRPKAGDFRVQGHLGGRSEIYTPTADEIEFGTRVLEVHDFV